jgi:hypothetical protein
MSERCSAILGVDVVTASSWMPFLGTGCEVGTGGLERSDPGD